MTEIGGHLAKCLPKRHTLRDYWEMLRKYVMLVTISYFVSCGESTKTDGPPPAPKYHTQTNPGAWENKAKEHEVQIRYLSSDTIEVTIPLRSTMQPRHYIEAIVLHDDKEKEIAARYFKPSYIEAKTEFKLPDPRKQYYIIAKCNSHDMWMSAVPAPQ